MFRWNRRNFGEKMRALFAIKKNGAALENCIDWKLLYNFILIMLQLRINLAFKTK